MALDILRAIQIVPQAGPRGTFPADLSIKKTQVRLLYRIEIWFFQIKNSILYAQHTPTVVGRGLIREIYGYKIFIDSIF